MRHLLLLPLILGIASPTYADLGPADTSPKTKEAQQTRFDAWCIEKYADCVVSLEGRKLIVDKSRGINKSQLIQTSFQPRVRWARKEATEASRSRVYPNSIQTTHFR